MLRVTVHLGEYDDPDNIVRTIIEFDYVHVDQDTINDLRHYVEKAIFDWSSERIREKNKIVDFGQSNFSLKDFEVRQ